MVPLCSDQLSGSTGGRGMFGGGSRVCAISASWGMLPLLPLLSCRRAQRIASWPVVDIVPHPCPQEGSEQL